jgi:hypothetical protein
MKKKGNKLYMSLRLPSWTLIREYNSMAMYLELHGYGN